MKLGVIMQHPKEEITYLMVKPDGVRRGLTGEIIRRIEQRGLKIVALRMIEPDRDKVDNHYPKDQAWITRLGEKTTATYEKFGYDLDKDMGTRDKDKIGQEVRGWLVDYMISAPLVGMVIKGVHAVDMVRKLAGPTMPADAAPGTIRGDYSVDSAALANREKRSVFNLVHASETQEEAKHEIEHWFGEFKLLDYDRTDDAV
jgi:nucleoside-diphosphate kinase